MDQITKKQRITYWTLLGATYTLLIGILVYLIYLIL